MAGEVYVILNYEMFSDAPYIMGYVQREEDAINYCNSLSNEQNWYRYKRIHQIEMPTYDGGWDS